MANAIIFVLSLAFALVAIYSRVSADWIFKVLEDKYPEYYEKAERPSLIAFNLRRAGRANDLLLRAIYGSLPNDFPKDEAIRKRIDTMQSLFLFVGLPSWIGLGIMIIAGFRS